jgi:hypothetical protein
MLEHGLVGTGLMRAILQGGRTIAQAALEHGDGSQRALDWHARLFRQCLDVLALATGHASGPARGSRPVVDRWLCKRSSLLPGQDDHVVS